MNKYTAKYIGAALVGAVIGGAIVFSYLYSLVGFLTYESTKKEVSEAKMTAVYQKMYQIKSLESYEEFLEKMSQSNLDYLYQIRERKNLCSASLFLVFNSDCDEWFEKDVSQAIEMLESAGIQ